MTLTMTTPSDDLDRARPRASHAQPLTPAELLLLRVIHEADRDRGGLSWRELDDDEAETCTTLLDRELVEALSEYGEAPDGEEDERDAGAAFVYRMTGRGVEALHDARGRDA